MGVVLYTGSAILMTVLRTMSTLSRSLWADFTPRPYSVFRPFHLVSESYSSWGIMIILIALTSYFTGSPLAVPPSHVSSDIIGWVLLTLVFIWCPKLSMCSRRTQISHDPTGFNLCSLDSYCQFRYLVLFPFLGHHHSDFLGSILRP